MMIQGRIGLTRLVIGRAFAAASGHGVGFLEKSMKKPMRKLRQAGFCIRRLREFRTAQHPLHAAVSAHSTATPRTVWTLAAETRML